MNKKQEQWIRRIIFIALIAICVVFLGPVLTMLIIIASQLNKIINTGIKKKIGA